MTPEDVMALLGSPAITNLEPGVWGQSLEYRPQNMIPYSPASNLIVDEYSIYFAPDNKFDDIYVTYKAKDERGQMDIRGGRLSKKFMPDPMCGKWGKIRTGMSRKEVQALLETPDSRIMVDPGGDLVWKYYPRNDIPYSSGTTNLVVDMISVSFRFGVDEVKDIFIVYKKPDKRRNT